MGTSIEGVSVTNIAEELKDYLDAHGWRIDLIGGSETSGQENLDQIISGKLDLAFTLNNQAHNNKSDEIRTVLPFFPNVSYIFYRNNLNPQGLHDLLNSRSFAVTEEDLPVFLNLFGYYGIHTDSLEYNLITDVDSGQDFVLNLQNGNDDVVCVFAAIHNPYVSQMIENGWEILSLGDISFSNRGSSVEGFCMKNPRSRPFIVPRNFFGQKPEYPIYTIAMDEIMITSEAIDERVIYDLVSDIYSGKHFLSQNNLLFNYLTESFNQDALNFPLHQGTINYLRRDAPTFFERYAELFGVAFSILVVLFGGITSLKKIRKERIDKYYRRVMNCQNIEQLEAISKEAVKQLEDEKLSADESFSILLNLIDKKRRQLISYPLNTAEASEND
jgi:TRAP-type uncharacterized transport system substrate-binding protein